MPLITFSPNTVIKSADFNANFTGLANGTLMTSPVIGNPTLKNYIATGIFPNGNSGASAAIDWSQGDKQSITVTANTTLSYANAVAGQILTLIVNFDSTGGWTVALPVTKWANGAAGSFTNTPNSINILTVAFDGTNYLTALTPGFA